MKKISRSLMNVAALSLLLSSPFAGARAEGPSLKELEKSHDRGLCIEQPSYVKNQEKQVQEAKPRQTAPKPVASTQKRVSDLVPVKRPVVKAKVMVAKGKMHPQQTKNHVQVIKHTVQPESSQSIQTVAYENDTVISAWLNKTGPNPKYKDGEKMEINVKASRDCNLTIYDFDGRGKLTQIFPNQFQPNSLVKGGDTVTIGGADSQFDYQLSMQPGEEKVKESIFIFAYPVSEAPLSIAMNRSDNASPFRSAEMTPEEYRKLVNQSKVFFSREVKVVAKSQNQIKPVSQETTQAPNKIELSLVIEK